MGVSGTLRSRVALFLCSALLVSLFPAVFTTAQETAPAAPPTLRIAVAKCTDATEGSVPGLADLLERSLWKSLAEQAGVQLIESGSSTQPDRTLSARIIAINAASKRLPTSVQVVAESTDPATNSVVYRTAVQGGGFSRPGEGMTAQVERAVAEAAQQIAVHVVRAERLRGSITTVDRGISATIDRGSADGLTTGTELEIVRGGKLVGHIRIDRVDQKTATGQLFDLPRGMEVQAGDQARIASEPVPLVPTPVQKPPGKKGSNSWVAVVAGLVVVGALAAVLGSHKGNGGSPAVPSGQISVVAADRQIAADGTTTTTITATVRDDKGNPLPNGTPADFQTSLGLIAPAQAVLKKGVATATLRSANVPGTATVTVVSKGLTGTVKVEFTPTSTSDVAVHLSVVANPQQVPADGTSQTTITASVGDKHRNPVPDGTLVAFTTDRGLIKPAKIATSGGTAQATLRSGTDPGKATVAVKVGQLHKNVTVDFVPVGTGGKRTLVVTASTARIVADGTSTSTITATAKTITGNPVPDGSVIALTTTAGTVFPATTTTTNGVATATLRSDRKPAHARVTAALGTLRASTVVTFVSQDTNVASIFLKRDPTEIVGDGTSTSTITATVRDAKNQAVPDGTLVVFSTTRGVVSPGVATTTSGAATSTLRSEPTPVDRVATVTVVAGQEQAVTTVKFTGTGTTPARITLVADKTSIPADGASTARLSITLNKANAAPAAHAKVNVTTTAGLLRLPGTSAWQASVIATTDTHGNAAVTLRSTTTPATATVTAAAPSVTPQSASVVITFSSLVITGVTADPANVAVGGNSTSKVTATVVDTGGNPAPDGTVVQFSIVNQTQLPSATITSSAATAGGKAVAIFRSGTEVGTARIRAAIPSANASTEATIIGITAGPAAFIGASADKFITSARAIGSSGVVTVTALVSDKFNNPVEDGTVVRFDATPAGGAVITGTAATSAGFATASLYPNGFVGDVHVIASTTGAGGQKIDSSARPVVVHMAGAPVSVEIIAPNASSYSTASPLPLYTETDQPLTIQLKDSSGGPADPTAQVTFRLDRGSVTPDPASITVALAGTANATFRSEQATPTGTVDKIIAVSEKVSSPPLYVFISVKP